MTAINLADGELAALHALAKEGIEASEASARPGAEDSEDCAFWAPAHGVKDCLDAAKPRVVELGTVTVLEGVEVEFTDEALAWLEGQRSEIEGKLERTRTTVEFQERDVLALFALETITDQLSPDSFECLEPQPVGKMAA